MRIITAAAVATALLCAGAASAQTTANPNAGQNAAVKDPKAPAGTPSKGANSFTKKQAMGRMAKAGYPVTDLSKDKDGLWHGASSKDGKAVDVSLDFKGNVTAQ
jgi:hypothetical protein